MPTAYNTTVKLYKGVPLVKGGTEVLYLSGAAAEGILSAYTHATFTEYYYTRENRGYIQVDATIQACEGCNYVGFQNVSHGGKWYFGFIDQIVYINDNCTEIRFTVDPFTTYLGDTQPLPDTYVVRNTDKFDIIRANLQADYMPPSIRKSFTLLSYMQVSLDSDACYLACGNVVAPEIGNTGIKLAKLTDANLKAILENGGAIIGAYMFPSAWAGGNPAITRNLTTLTGDATAHAAAYTHNKLKTGVYNKVVLSTPQGNKFYDLEQFADPTNIEIATVGLLFPGPSVFCYPRNYNGVADNLAEGIMCNAPAVPIAANAVYTNAEKFNDALSIFSGTLSGAVSGSRGGWVGAIAGAAGGALGGVYNQAKNEIMTRYEPPFVSSNSTPAVSMSRTIDIYLTVSHPYASDLERIDKYFDYYGYAMNTQLATGYTINDDDGAYLQTGDVYLCGSEADDEINARLMRGIKIRKTL